MMIRRILIASIAILSANLGFAQEHNHVKCGADIELQRQLEDPEVRARYEAFQEAARRYAQNPNNVVSRNEQGIRIIPTVFHILHAGGNENITRAKVEKQMEVLNEDFRRLNEDTVNMPERFRGDTEYTNFVFTADAIEDFVGDSAYALLNNRYGDQFAFHFNNGSGALEDSLADGFQNVIEISVSANADTFELADAFADAVNAQNGLIASFTRDTVFDEAPNFTVDGAELDSLNYTTEHTFTTSWNGSSTDTTYSDTLMVVLYEDVQDPFLATDTLHVFDADVTYDVFDGSGAVTATLGFTAEGDLDLSFTIVPAEFGDYIVSVSNDGLGYTDDVLLADLWSVTSTVTQQGSYIPADSRVEFRLATKDPLGNCSDGIVRVFTSKTNDANNGTGFKAESYWNAYSYLNVWVVDNIDFDTGQNGVTLGYAQFPGTGLLSTDGITVRADNIDERYLGGRTATHEVGHWLDLRHIWGDATCGSDDVLDTPTHNGPNFGICGNSPTQNPPGQGGSSQFHNAPYNPNVCSPDQPDGEMFMNYMDYSSDNCMNMFTLGQKARMDFILEGDGTEQGYRQFMVSQENLEATGVADPYTPSDCAPISDFYFDQGNDFATQQMICVGEEVDFEESAYNGQVDDFAWTFEGGDPATSSSTNPNNIQYDNPGVFDVTLEVSNAVGSDVKVSEDMIIVSPLAAQYQNNWGYVDSYWDEDDFLADYVIFNQDGGTNRWEWYQGPDGGSTGNESARMLNVGNKVAEIDELISPSYDLSTISSPTLQFRYSGASIDNTPNDNLRIMVSDDCGESWSTRETLSDFELTNAGLVANGYVPNAQSTWTDIEIGLGSFGNKPNVRVKFRWVSGGRGNNFYIDDLTISGSPIGMDDLERQIDLSIAPNPTSDMTAVTMRLHDAAKVRMEVIDILGKEVTPVLTRDMTNGAHRFDIDMSAFTTGVYYLRIFVGNDMVVKKVVKN